MSRRVFGFTEADFDAAMVYGDSAARARAFESFGCAREGATLPANTRNPRHAVLDDDAWRAIFHGNAFEAMPRLERCNRRKRCWRLRRMLRALMRWLRQPSFWSPR